MKKDFKMYMPKRFATSVLIAAFMALTVVAAPARKNINQEAIEYQAYEETKPVMHHFYNPPTSLTRVGRLSQRNAIHPSKDTYELLRSLKKVIGPDDNSPFCRICTNQMVDAKTYDYFCLPNSDGMDGDICDKLTVLGTTTPHRISRSCKLLYSRSPTVCK